MAKNDKAGPDWDGLIGDVVQKIGLLRIAWHGTEESEPKLHAKLKQDIYVPCLTLLAEFCTRIHEEGECAEYSGDGPLSSPFALGRVLTELFARRDKQDAEWGGPEHYYRHSRADWCRSIHQYLADASVAFYGDSDVQYLASVFEDKMLDVAALAVAAVQSSRRKQSDPAKESAQ